MKNIIVIVGPTAVGKTKLSVELAKKINAEIINGDSMQVYQRMNIGTAKIKEEEKENIPHHLFDIADLSVNYTVYDYQKDCRKKIEEILSRGKRVIIVGGTGLYIKAALYDYQFTDGTCNDSFSSKTNEEIFALLKEKDSSIDIHPNNRKRMIRLLNKYNNHEEITHHKDDLLYDASFIGLTTERSILYDKINLRVDKMMKDGLLDEACSLKESYPSSKALTTAIGYKEFIPYFSKDISLEEVVEQIAKNSRHYAKRQYTFFLHQFNCEWFMTNYHHFQETIDQVYQYLNKI